MCIRDRAIDALDAYHKRVKKYIGAYAAEMNGVDAIVFTAGLGENGIEDRLAIASNLEVLGVKMDAEANNVRGKERVISAADSKVKVLDVYKRQDMDDTDEKHYGLNGSATQVIRIFPPEPNTDKDRCV